MKLLKAKCIFISILLLGSSLPSAADGCATASLVNPDAINDGGMGGTGAPANGGLGGTGIQENGRMNVNSTGERGGLGGAGIVAERETLLPDDAQGDIAIMGVVTGFASVCVNGEEVHYDNTTPIYDNGQPAKLVHLAVGKTVMLKAERVNGRLNAKAIGLYDAVSGPVSGLDTVRQQMRVMGQTVRMNSEVMQQVKNINPNAGVRVSGHRLTNGEIVATRVDAGQSTRANTIGTVSEVSRNSFNVNGTTVTVADSKLLVRLKVGSEVRVSGAWSENALKVQHIDAQPTQRLIGRANIAILEGYVRLDSQTSGKLAGTELTFAHGNAGSKELERTSGKLIKIELRRNQRGDWIYDKLEERKGRLFEQRDHHDKNKDENDHSNSGSESNSGSNSGGRHESSSGSSGHGSGSNAGSGGRDSVRDSASSHGGSGRSDSTGRSGGSGSSSGGKGSGKYK